MIDDQAWAGFFAKAEKIEFPPQLSVVPFPGFLEHMEKFLQGLLGWECGPINPLEYSIPSISSPICSRYIQKPKGFDSPCRREMGSFTEVQETALPIERDSLRELPQMLNFISLANLLKSFDRFFFRNLLPDKRFIFGNDL
jgi:hypothetical protein